MSREKLQKIRSGVFIFEHSVTIYILREKTMTFENVIPTS